MKRREFLKLLPLAAAAPAVARGLIEIPPQAPLANPLIPPVSHAKTFYGYEFSSWRDILAEVTLHRPLWDSTGGAQKSFNECVIGLIREEQKKGRPLQARCDVSGAVIDSVSIPSFRAEELIACFNGGQAFMLTPEIKTHVVEIERRPTSTNIVSICCKLVMTGRLNDGPCFTRQEICRIFQVPPHLIG